MLSYEEKKAIIESFSELVPVPISLGRMNYHYEESAVAKTVVVKALHPKSGNAFVYAGYLPKEETKDGYLSVINADEAELREKIQEALLFLQKTEEGFVKGYTEIWTDQRGTELFLIYQPGIWTVEWTPGIPESVFKTKEAAEDYLVVDGFQFKKIKE